MAIDPRQIGNRIRQIRGQKTLKEFGAELGKSYVTVRNYENGQIPKTPILEKIAGLDPQGRGYNWLVGTEGDEGSKGVRKIAQFPDPLADLTPKQKRLVERMLKLLRIKSLNTHLEGQITLLEEALENMDRKKGTK